jgi:tetratricopeptide (TPR) repeat protein
MLAMLTRSMFLAALVCCAVGVARGDEGDEPIDAGAATAAADDKLFENRGQSHLDEAVSAKLAAENLDDLSRVIKLCERAIDGGLNKENREFAEKLMASALFQRAQAVSAAIFGPAQPDSRWREMRDAALNDLSRAMELDEQAAMYLLAVRLESLPGGSRKRAMAALDKAIDLAGDDADTKFEALMMRAGTGESPEKKLSDYAAAHKLRPQDPVPLRARGALELSLDRPEDALADFDAAIKLDPDHAPSYEVRGMTLTILKRLDEARESYARAAELAPKSAAMFVQRAQLSLLTEQYDQAIEQATQALKLDPQMPGALLLRAQAYARSERSEQALADIEQVLELQPNLAPAVKLRALVEASAGKTTEAIADLERIVREEPRDLETQMQLALLYRTQKNYTKALSIFDAAVAIDPDNWMLRYARGDALLSIGRHKAAIADYNAAVKQSPRQSGLLNNLAWVLATSPAADVRDGERAVSLAKLAAEATDFKQANILSTLGAAYAEAGDLDTAKKWVRKALEIADEQERKALEKELASYEAGKPVREMQREDQTAGSSAGESAEATTASPPSSSALKR